MPFQIHVHIVKCADEKHHYQTDWVLTNVQFKRVNYHHAGNRVPDPGLWIQNSRCRLLLYRTPHKPCLIRMALGKKLSLLWRRPPAMKACLKYQHNKMFPSARSECTVPWKAIFGDKKRKKKVVGNPPNGPPHPPAEMPQWRHCDVTILGRNVRGIL